MASVTIGNLLFGFATKLWAACVCRGLLLGAMNGWITLLGPMCFEVGGAERQAHVFSHVFGGGT